MSPEMTVLESIHCPTCSAHYGLKASRVRSGIRRALCFRCSTIFSIEREVQRLTAQAGPVAEEVGTAGGKQCKEEYKVPQTPSTD